MPMIHIHKYNFVPLNVEKYLQDIFQCSIQNSSKSVSSEIKNITHVVWLHLLITCRLAKNVGLFWPPVISNESFLQFITDTFCRFLFIKYKFKIIWNYRDIFCMNMNLIISCCVAMMTNVNTLSISFFFNFKTIFNQSLKFTVATNDERVHQHSSSFYNFEEHRFSILALNQVKPLKLNLWFSHLPVNWIRFPFCLWNPFSVSKQENFPLSL